MKLNQLPCSLRLSIHMHFEVTASRLSTLGIKLTYSKVLRGAPLQLSTLARIVWGTVAVKIKVQFGILCGTCRQYSDLTNLLKLTQKKVPPSARLSAWCFPNEVLPCCNLTN